MPSCSALRFAGYSRPALRLVVAGDPAGPAVSNRLEENLIRTTEVLSSTRLDFQRPIEDRIKSVTIALINVSLRAPIPRMAG